MKIENFRRPLASSNDPAGLVKHGQNVSSLGFLEAERRRRGRILLISRR
jgi:hypothetical protein